MRAKTWLVARHEFRRQVLRRGFLVALLGFPSLLVLVWGGLALFLLGQGDDPVGLVDDSDLLLPVADYDPASYGVNSVPFIDFADETAARAALDRGEIQAYAVLPADYQASGELMLYHNGDAFDGIDSDLAAYIRASLLSTSESPVARHLVGNVNATFVSLAGESNRDSPLAFFVPFLVGLIFLVAMFSTSGALIRAVVDEKENRTMEIVITSLRPRQLIAGKIIALVSAGLLQIVVWLLFAALAYLIARARFAGFPAISFTFESVAIVILYFVPLYVILAGVTVAVGISVTSAGEAQQAVGIMSLLTMAPIYLSIIIFENPASPLAVILSLFPFSAPLTLLTRAQFASIPIWQYTLSWLIMLVTAVLAVRLASRVLEVGMLRYGQRLSWREMVRVARRPAEATHA